MDVGRLLRSRTVVTSSPVGGNSDFAVLYKTKSKGLKRNQRSNVAKEKRKVERAEALNKYRRISAHFEESIQEGDSTQISPAPTPSRTASKRNKRAKDPDEVQRQLVEKLEAYRVRRKRERELESSRKKPVFKTGAVHHKVYPFDSYSAEKLSQTFNFGKSNLLSSAEVKRTSESLAKKIVPTMSGAFNNKKGGQKQQIQSASKNLLNEFKVVADDGAKENRDDNDRGESPVRSRDTKMIPKIAMTPCVASPSLPTVKEGDESEDTVPSPENDIVFKTPSFAASARRRRSKTSPLLDALRKDICFTRGSSSDRRRARRGLSPKLNSPMDFMKDNEEPKLKGRELGKDFEDIADEDKARVAPFRKLFDDNKSELIRLCEEWEGKGVPQACEDVKENILLVVGQARLIMNSKGRLQQFSNIVDNCEFKQGEKETTTDDVRGFWDMIYVQISDIYKKFKELKTLEKNEWKKVELQNPKPINRPKNTENKVKKKEAKASGGLRAMLAARRAALKGREAPAIVIEAEPAPEENSITNDNKSFDGGFFKISSPVKRTSFCESGKSVSRRSRILSLSPKTPKTSANEESLRRSILINSIIKVSSMARRSIAGGDTSPTFGGLEAPPTPASSRMSLLPGMGMRESPKKSVGKGDNLIDFDSPDYSVTPRRSKRLSHAATPRRSIRLSEKFVKDGKSNLND